MSNSNARTDRLSTTCHFRAPLAVAGAAVLGLSLLLSVGPVLGAANSSNSSNGASSNGGAHGTSGNVKVHDAGTGVETAGTDNEPHVCTFWLGFTFDAPFEAGTWMVVSWAPTGDGSTVASGLYDTAGDGIDSSSIIELAGGHYRAEWAATGATSSKKKTFWVDAACEETAPAEESQVEEPAPPTDAPGSPAEESQVEEPAPPTDAPGSPAEESQVEESVLAGDGTGPADEQPPAEEAPATEDETPATDEEAPVTEEEAPAAPADEPAIEDLTTPNDPSDLEAPAQPEDAGATDPGTPPTQDELGSLGGADEPTMSDTRTPAAPVQSGLLAAMALLMMVAVHAATRGARQGDRENAVVRG